MSFRRLPGLVVLLIVLLGSAVAKADVLGITILTTASDDGGKAVTSFAGITVQVQRPVSRAVELALFESSALLASLGVSAETSELELDADKDLQQQLASIPSKHLLILDLPLALMQQVAPVANAMGLVAFNVRHSDAALRESLCLEHLYHAIPSDRMYFDALGQFLVYRGWLRVLVVRGPSESDEARAAVLFASLKKYGVNIVDVRRFSLSHHPDDRDQNKPEFLTGGVSYDAVAVIDTSRDYGRYLQYSTRSPRPVVGDVGLTPRSWHFALERYGAPQLNERYRQFKDDDVLPETAAMTDTEFAAWSAVKLISNSLGGRQNALGKGLQALMQSENTQVDLYKGTRGSVRHWNNQLRQPILLATQDAVVAIAPMPKFLHPKHYVDTLGFDEPESECRLR